MNPFDEEYAKTIIPQLEAEITELRKRMGMLEAELRDRGAIDARRSSIEVGTPAKGGALKVYMDPFGDPQANEDAINEAKRLLALAGGQPLPPTEVR
jgi:hypothetical protein